MTNEVRTKLKQSSGRIKEDIITSLGHIVSEIQLGYASEDYIEIKLERWTDQLESLKKCILNPPKIGLCGQVTPMMVRIRQ
jgi:hypothetical protein